MSFTPARPGSADGRGRPCPSTSGRASSASRAGTTLERGHDDQGFGELERARALRPDDPSVIAGLAIASAMCDRAAEAHRLLERLTAESGRRYVSPVIPASAHAEPGERERAFALLEKAYAAKDPLLAKILTLETQLGLGVPSGPAAAVRPDPRFADLVRRMGLPRRDAAGGPSTPASGAPGGGR